MVAGLAGLLVRQELFSPSPLVIAIQVCAVALMVWARITFGQRSFHAAANPTAGGLVTSGPYRFIRHPIYTAVCLFLWPGAIAHGSAIALSLALLSTVGAVLRMWCEEQLLVGTYPEYAVYAKKTKRMIPGVF
jgi:protein-S-isoprenylcysteine O-methyltransferase Ste14